MTSDNGPTHTQCFKLYEVGMNQLTISMTSNICPASYTVSYAVRAFYIPYMAAKIGYSVRIYDIILPSDCFLQCLDTLNFI